MLTVVAASSGLDSIPAGLWALLAAVVPAGGGVILALLKIISTLQEQIRVTNDKLIERVIPQLQSSVEASKTMLAVAQDMATDLAVAQALKDDRPPPPRRRAT